MHSKISRTYIDSSGSSRTLRKGLVLMIALSLFGTETASIFGQTAQKPGTSTVESQIKKFGVGKSVKVGWPGVS